MVPSPAWETPMVALDPQTKDVIFSWGVKSFANLPPSAFPASSLRTANFTLQTHHTGYLLFPSIP